MADQVRKIAPPSDEELRHYQAQGRVFHIGERHTHGGQMLMREPRVERLTKLARSLKAAIRVIFGKDRSDLSAEVISHDSSDSFLCCVVGPDHEWDRLKQRLIDAKDDAIASLDTQTATSKFDKKIYRAALEFFKNPAYLVDQHLRPTEIYVLGPIVSRKERSKIIAALTPDLIDQLPKVIGTCRINGSRIRSTYLVCRGYFFAEGILRKGKEFYTNGGKSPDFIRDLVEASLSRREIEYEGVQKIHRLGGADAHIQLESVRIVPSELSGAVEIGTKWSDEAGWGLTQEDAGDVKEAEVSAPGTVRDVGQADLNKPGRRKRKGWA